MRRKLTLARTLRALAGFNLTLASLALVPPAAHGANALIGHWLTGPANLTDSSGFTPAGTHDGLAVGANAGLLTWANDLPEAGFTGQSLDLRATSVGVLITNSAVTDSNYKTTFDAGISNQFSVAFWMKSAGTTTYDLVSKSGNTPYGWRARTLTVSGQPSTNLFVDFTMRSNPTETDVVGTFRSGNSAIQATNVINDGAWHHVVEVFDGTVAYRKIYIDGVLQRYATSIPYSVNYGGITNHLMLGANQNNVGGAPTGFFPGLLYDARVYNYPLSAGEVQYLNTAGQISGKDIFTFTFPGLGAATISNTSITITVPFTTNITALAPTYLCSALATCSPASGTTRDFTTPQTYTVTAQDSSTKTYTVTVTKSTPSTACDITSVSWGGYSAVILGTNVSLLLPEGTAVTALNPTVAISPFASVSPTSGSTNDFTTPVSYTVTAEDGVTSKTYSVAVLPLHSWTNSAGGTWSVGGNWSPNTAPTAGPTTALAFNTAGTYTSSQDLGDGFQLNLLEFGGATVNLTGNSLQFAGVTPEVLNSSPVSVTVSNNLVLSADTTFVNTGGVTVAGTVSGASALVKNGAGTLTLSGSANTYSGGTTVNAGILSLGTTANDLLGTAPVVVNSPAALFLNGNGHLLNDFTFNGAKVVNGNGFPAVLYGSVTLAATTTFDVSTAGSMGIEGNVSGPGGFTKLGTSSGPLSMNGVNTYSGITTVNAGALRLSSLYGGNAAQWTPANIIVAANAKLILNVGGPNDFTPAQAGALSASISTGLNNNGLQAGSTLGLCPANAGGTVSFAANLTDSTGVGGGSVGFLAYGSGTLELTGTNTYTGPTTVDNDGTLQVSSFNSVNGGTPPLASSSLGRPTTVANGTILLGGQVSYAGGSLTYTGTGETTDRVLSFGGANNSNYRLDQSGSGLLKFTSAFTLGADNRGPKTITLQGNTGGTGEIAGAIPVMNSAVGNETRLVKSGTGTWTLSGANAYTGTTTVNGGTLLVNGTNSGTGAFTVNTSATLGGTGSIAGAVTFNAGASAVFTVTPIATGESNLTYLKVAGPLTFSANEVHLNLPANLPLGTYTLALSSASVTANGAFPTPVVDSGSFAGGGNPSIGLDGTGTRLLLTVVPPPPTPQLISFTIASGNPTFSFATAVGYRYRVVYTDNPANPLTAWLPVVNEPTTDAQGWIAGTGGALSIIDPTATAGQTERFYRIEAAP